MTALGLSALGLAACDDVPWIIEQVKKGGGAPATGGAAPATPGTGGASGQPACTSGLFGGEAVCLDVASLKQNAYLACETSGLLLNDYVPTGACGSATYPESYRYVKYVCCPKVEPPPPPPPSPPPACTGEVQGGPTSCKDAATWKQYASDACVAKGTSLRDYGTYEDCGNGNTRYVKYECCQNPPPPPPMTCTSEVQGGPTSCKDVATWKRYASDACAAKGAGLTDYATYEDCGNGNSRYVKYSCCSASLPPPTPPPPPPPPVTCTGESQGSETSCKDAGTWKTYASEACAAKGATLRDYQPYQDCGNGNSRYVKYSCCTP